MTRTCGNYHDVIATPNAVFYVLTVFMAARIHSFTGVVNYIVSLYARWIY